MGTSMRLDHVGRGAIRVIIGAVFIAGMAAGCQRHLGMGGGSPGPVAATAVTLGIRGRRLKRASADSAGDLEASSPGTSAAPGRAMGGHVPVGDDAADGYRVRRHAGTGAGTVHAGRNAASTPPTTPAGTSPPTALGTTDRSTASHHVCRAHRTRPPTAPVVRRRVHGELP